MTKKRSFTVVVNVEAEPGTEEYDDDLGGLEDETYWALARSLEDMPGVVYVSREGESSVWTEDEA